MSNSTTKDFFKEQKGKSKVKSEIVVDFFNTYFSILNKTPFSDNGIYYIDLFSGPGIYEDGTKSTPMEILDVIDNYATDDAVNKIQMVFNDENSSYTNELIKNIKSHSVYPRLKNQPDVLNQSASQIDLALYTCSGKPIFSFIDPFGYKDVSFSQVYELIKPIGSDCILFFNVNRILQDVHKPSSLPYMKDIFGSMLDNAFTVADNPLLNQKQKGEEFVCLFANNLYHTFFEQFKSKKRYLFVLPFEFESDLVKKTSHYILFITKNYKAITEMKRIMVRNSNSFTTDLCYDEKDLNVISMFNRSDCIYEEIKAIIIEMLKNSSSLIEKSYNVMDWSEYIDRFSMYKNYTITPYTVNEIKETIKKLDNEGRIIINSPIKKKRITNNTYFSFDKGLIGE